ncbi:MAG: hypothetical protein PHS98_02965 [Bacilli bacterium]|nr:hypothetical protein [Bacilli bacterium]
MYGSDNDERPYNLNLLFNALGAGSYIRLLANKLKEQNEFGFSSNEEQLITNSKLKINSKVSSFIDNMVVRDIANYKVGITFIEDEYRNDVAMELRKMNFDIDLVMMIILQAALFHIVVLKTMWMLVKLLLCLAEKVTKKLQAVQ